MAGILDYTPFERNLNVDDTGNTFFGTINGKFRVYIDPYSANSKPLVTPQLTVVTNTMLSVIRVLHLMTWTVYCPYVPLQMVRAVGENTFQPKIGFKTRYGIQQPIRQKVKPKDWVDSELTPTVTTEESAVKTSCDIGSLHKDKYRGPEGPLFPHT